MVFMVMSFLMNNRLLQIHACKSIFYYNFLSFTFYMKNYAWTPVVVTAEHLERDRSVDMVWRQLKLDIFRWIRCI